MAADEQHERTGFEHSAEVTPERIRDFYDATKYPGSDIKKTFDALQAKQPDDLFSYLRMVENHSLIPCTMYEAFVDEMIGKLERSCVVAKTVINDEVEVSTVYLGGFMISKGHENRRFETMIMGGQFSGVAYARATWGAAEKLHTEIVSLMRERQTALDIQAGIAAILDEPEASP